MYRQKRRRHRAADWRMLEAPCSSLRRRVSLSSRACRRLSLRCCRIRSTASADITAFLGSDHDAVERAWSRASPSASGLLIVGVRIRVRATPTRIWSRRRRDCGRSCSTVCCRRRSRSPGCSSTAPPAAACYRETLSTSSSETNFGINVGGGVKMSLAGPLRLRLDYRVFTLRGTPLHSKPAALLCGDQSEVLSAAGYVTARVAAVTYRVTDRA